MHKQEQGFILLVVIMLLGILAIAALSTTESNVAEQRMTINAQQKAISFENAEALRLSIVENYPPYRQQLNWPQKAGGTKPDDLYSGIETGDKYFSILTDSVGNAYVTHYLSTNPIEFRDADGNLVDEKNSRPVVLKVDAVLKDDSGAIYAELSMFAQKPTRLAGNGMAMHEGYGARGYSASNGMAEIVQLRSTSTDATSEVAKTIIESDYRYINAR